MVIDLPEGDICRPLPGYLLTHRADDRLARPMLAALLTALVSGKTRIDSPDVSPLHPVVGKALEYIQRKFAEDPAFHFKLGEIAAAAGLRKTNLVRLFRVHLGQTPMRCIFKARLDRAVELLRTTDFNLAVIAAMTGFASGPALHRWFGKVFGASAGRRRGRCRVAHI